MTRRRNQRRTVPDVATNITREEMEALRPPPDRGLKSSGTGYLFVYYRQTQPQKGNKATENCRTLRVRIKKENLPDGRPYYEEFSAGWTTPRDAAKFVAGLFRLRYGPDWTRLFLANRAGRSNNRLLSRSTPGRAGVAVPLLADEVAGRGAAERRLAPRHAGGVGRRVVPRREARSALPEGVGRRPLPHPRPVHRRLRPVAGRRPGRPRTPTP